MDSGRRLTLLLAILFVTGTFFTIIPTYASSDEGGNDTGEGGGSEDSGSESGSEPEPEKEIIDEGPEDEHRDIPETETEPEPEPEPNTACMGGPPGIDGCPPLEDEPTEPSLPVSPSHKPLPYCDLMPDDFQGSCHDRRDFDDITGLYPCNDGTQKKDYHQCIDASNPDWPKHCTKDFDKCKERTDKVIKIIKNVNIIKKINSVSNNGNLDIEQTIVAINYDEGAGINCVFGDDNDGQCETFDVNKDPGKEPLLQIIPFS